MGSVFAEHLVRRNQYFVLDSGSSRQKGYENISRALVPRVGGRTCDGDISGLFAAERIFLLHKHHYGTYTSFVRRAFVRRSRRIRLVPTGTQKLVRLSARVFGIHSLGTFRHEGNRRFGRDVYKQACSVRHADKLLVYFIRRHCAHHSFVPCMRIFLQTKGT